MQGKNINVSQPTAMVSEPKAAALSEAIQSIANVVYRLESVSRRIIEGSAKDPCREMPDNPPLFSLLDLLDNGGDRIHEQCTEMYKQIEGIEAALF